MFFMASTFDQDIGEWDVSKGSDFVSRQEQRSSVLNKDIHVLMNKALITNIVELLTIDWTVVFHVL